MTSVEPNFQHPYQFKPLSKWNIETIQLSSDSVWAQTLAKKHTQNPRRSKWAHLLIYALFMNAIPNVQQETVPQANPSTAVARYNCRMVETRDERQRRTRKKNTPNRKVKIDGWRSVSEGGVGRATTARLLKLNGWKVTTKFSLRHTGICIKYKWQQFRWRIRMWPQCARRQWWRDRRQRWSKWKVYTQKKKMCAQSCFVSFNQSRCEMAKRTQFLDYSQWKCWASVRRFRHFHFMQNMRHTQRVFCWLAHRIALPPRFSRVNSIRRVDNIFLCVFFLRCVALVA